MELKDRYRIKRKKAFQRERIPGWIRTRRCLHPVLIRAIKLARVAGKQKLHVIKDDRNPSNKPIVYACNHIGWDDIQMTFEAIQDHAWLFWGNPEYRTPHYYVLMGNGAVCVDSYDKEDRRIAKETAIRLLKAGESLLIYPEGAWNAISNLPVMKLFPGAAEIAILSGAEIVPIGIAQNGPNEYCVSIGRNFPTYGYSVSEKWVLTEKLRDLIAKEVWNTWEALPLAKRADLPRNAQQAFEDFLSSQMHGAFTMVEVHRERFHDEKEREADEAFRHLGDLAVSRRNSFLMNKRCSGYLTFHGCRSSTYNYCKMGGDDNEHQ